MEGKYFSGLLCAFGTLMFGAVELFGVYFGVFIWGLNTEKYYKQQKAATIAGFVVGLTFFHFW